MSGGKKLNSHEIKIANKLFECQAFLKWVTEGGELPKVPEGSVGFTVDKAGAVTSYEENGSCTVKANCFAIGSGREMALAAMAAGADPQKAVEIAISLDV